METVKLFVFDIDLAIRHKDLLLKSLNEEQKNKMWRYKNEIDQMRSLASSYLINQLSKAPVLYNECGKPYFKDGPHFNISHSGRYIVMVTSSQEIGVDIEENKKRDFSSLKRIFNEVEAKMANEHQDFYYMWCAKESLIKCMGATVGAVKDVPSLPLNGLKTYKGIDYQCQAFIYDNHIVSITRRGNEQFVVKTVKIERLPFPMN